MLESTSERLMQHGMPHHNCPDKVLLGILCLEAQTLTVLLHDQAVHSISALFGCSECPLAATSSKIGHD